MNKVSDPAGEPDEFGRDPGAPPVKPSKDEPARSGACPYCLRNHLLKVRGYAKEIREDPTREWEAEMLLQNLLLAEDHAEAMGDWNLRSAIRAERLRAENGEFVDAESLLARAREKILESQRGVGIENKAEPAPSEEQ